MEASLNLNLFQEDLAASSESDKSFGGLSRSIRMKRSVSSLKGSNGQGCDIDLKTQCVVEARQVHQLYCFSMKHICCKLNFV